MYSKLAFVLGYVAAGGQSEDDRFTLTGVSCDGNGLMTIDYTFDNSHNNDEKIANFECGDDARKTGANGRTYLEFDPYNCGTVTEGSTADANGDGSGSDMASFNVAKKFTLHSAVQGTLPFMFNLRAYTMEVSCAFGNEFVLKTEDYTVREGNENVDLTTFTMGPGDFTMELNHEFLENGMPKPFKANTPLMATITATGAPWAKLNEGITFAPTECTVQEEANEAFNIIGGDAGACGYDELLTKLTGSGGNRTWVLRYQTFVISASSDGGTYTLSCTVSMCTKENRKLVNNHACYQAGACPQD